MGSVELGETSHTPSSIFWHRLQILPRFSALLEREQDSWTPQVLVNGFQSCLSSSERKVLSCASKNTLENYCSLPNWKLNLPREKYLLLFLISFGYVTPFSGSSLTRELSRMEMGTQKVSGSSSRGRTLVTVFRTHWFLSGNDVYPFTYALEDMGVWHAFGVWVCMCGCVHVWENVCIYVHTYWVCVSIFVCAWVCLWMCPCMRQELCACMSFCVYTYLSTCVCERYILVSEKSVYTCLRSCAKV